MIESVNIEVTHPAAAASVVVTALREAVGSSPGFSISRSTIKYFLGALLGEGGGQEKQRQNQISFSTFTEHDPLEAI